MAAENSSYGDGPFSTTGDDAQSEQPLVAIKPRGRPSNWAKKFAFQQMKDSQQAVVQAQPQAKKSPTPETVVQRKSTRTRTRKSKGGPCSPDAVEAAPMTVAPQMLMKSGPSKSPSPAPQPSVDEAAQLPVIRDDDSLFEGDAGSLFGGDDEPQAFSRAPSHTNSLFVGEDEPLQTQPSRPAAPAEDRRSPFRDSNGTIPHEPVAANEQDGTHGSVCGGNVEAAQSMLAFSDGRRGTREPTSSFHGDDEPAKAPSAPSSGEDAVHSSPAQGSIATPLPRTPPATASQRTHIECELATMADEVRRWEAVTQQVATSTAEMSALIKDLAAQSFASRPPSASVRAMLSPADQARFRDQLLKATQLSLKADLVQTLKERHSETRQTQMRCAVLLAVAVVLAAFMVSPFAGRAVEWLEWAVLDR